MSPDAELTAKIHDTVANAKELADKLAVLLSADHPTYHLSATSMQKIVTALRLNSQLVSLVFEQNQAIRDRVDQVLTDLGEK